MTQQFLDFHPRKMKTYVPTKTYTYVNVYSGFTHNQQKLKIKYMLFNWQIRK